MKRCVRVHYDYTCLPKCVIKSGWALSSEQFIKLWNIQYLDLLYFLWDLIQYDPNCFLLKVELVSSMAEGSLSKMAEVRDAHVTPSNDTGPSNQVEYWSGEQPVITGSSAAFRPGNLVMTETNLDAESGSRPKDFLPPHVSIWMRLCSKRFKFRFKKITNRWWKKLLYWNWTL